MIYSGETQEVVGWEKGGETGYLYRLQSTDSGKLQLIFVKTLDNS